MTTEPTAAPEASFNIDSIKEIMDNFDPATLLPDLEKIFSVVGQVCRYAVLAAPVVLLVLGLVYLFLTPREANHYIGYRCYFGMGSVQAWRFTQRLAGIVFAGLGILLGAVMLFSSLGFADTAVEELVWKALRLLGWQVGLTLLANIAIQLTTVIVFDRKGEYRSKKKRA